MAFSNVNNLLLAFEGAIQYQISPITAINMFSEAFAGPEM
jgi:hypothetical protein